MPSTTSEALLTAERGAVGNEERRSRGWVRCGNHEKQVNLHWPALHYQ
jgi:hypothetical protein